MIYFPRHHLTRNQLGFRLFSDSRATFATHYETLSLPRNATHREIKSRFYKLSKEHHPDLNPGSETAKQKFVALSEAYSVLGDERKRRAYDSSLGRQMPHATGHHHPYAPGHGGWTYETRGARATYAWEHPRRRAPPPGFNPKQHTHYPRHQTHPSPFDSPHVRRATGHRPIYQRVDPNSPMERIRRDSGVKRVAQVIGVLLIVTAISGGWRVHAG